MNGPLSTFNGINGATGSYLLPPMTARELAAIAKGETPDEELLQDLSARARLTSKRRSLKEGVDPKYLGQSGWGVIFAFSDQEKLAGIKDALGKLLAHRKDQAGDRYRVYSAVDAYRPNESKTDFLSRHGVGPGPVDPDRVPYYLLIVGDPESIPFSFQYQLDVQYAVGRLHFDSLEAYARYAARVVAAETSPAAPNRGFTFFGVQNPDDPATQLSAANLIGPLAEKMAPDLVGSGQPLQTFLGPEATKANLARVMGGQETPALLFTASHGMGFPAGDPRQLPHQGALLCQDWPGPTAWSGPIPEDHYFSADDLSGQADLRGLLAFFFACYGAGTPRMEDFAHQAFRDPVAIAPRPFLAHLPQRMLSHQGGGALAVIGHVERAWGYSFQWEQASSQLAVFESTLKRLVSGHPVGSAMEFFNQRYAELSTVLSEELRGVQFGKIVDDLALAGMWTANNDARSYMVLGDPAVRLPSAGHEIPASGINQAADRLPALVSEHRPTSSERIGSENAPSLPPVIADPLPGAVDSLARSMARIAVRLSVLLEASSDPALSMEVTTYTTRQFEPTGPGSGPDPVQKALTRISLEGDTALILPDSPGALDKEIWDKHLDMVGKARSSRAETLQAIVSAAACLTEALNTGKVG